jgi:hypothetical protein
MVYCHRNIVQGKCELRFALYHRQRSGDGNNSPGAPYGSCRHVGTIFPCYIGESQRLPPAAVL